MNSQKVEVYFFFVIFLAALGLALFLFLPFLAPLALAAVFAVIFYPVFLWIKRVGGVPYDALAAFLTLLVVVGLVLLPLSLLGYLLFDEARSLLSHLSSGQSDVFAAVQSLERFIQQYIPAFELNVRQYAQQALGTISQSLGVLFTGTAQVILALFLSLIALYYFLKDGVKFRAALVRYSPLEDRYDNEILVRLQKTVNSVIKGSLLIAVLQGLMTGLGLYIFGVPNPVLWGAFAGLGALIPGIGTTLVLAPAVAYLFFAGAAGAALGLIIWGATAVGMIDNFLGPYFMGRGAAIHPLFILLAVLGGLAMFGPVGLILGPLVLSLVVVLGHIYTSLIEGYTSTS